MDTGRIILSGLIFCALGTVHFEFVSAKFPDDPKPCKYEDHKCITNAINYIMQEKSEGDSSINLIKIDPLRVPKIVMKQGAESPVNIDLVFTQNDIIGLKNVKAIKSSGFGKDINSKHAFLLKLPVVSLVGDYTISGKVLILPIAGAGKSNMTMVDLELEAYWIGKSYEKNGETYMKVEKLTINFNPKRLYFYFGNLFNGDKALGDNMNLFLNENWRDIYNEVRVTLTEALTQIFEGIIDNIFKKLPYKKYFIEE